MHREQEMETMSRRPFARHTVHFDDERDDSPLSPSAVEPLHADATVSVHSVIVSLPPRQQQADVGGKLAIGCVLVKTPEPPPT